MVVKLSLYLAVALGSALGGVFRLAIAEITINSGTLPLAAIVVNIAGSFLIGTLAQAGKAGGKLNFSAWQQQFWLTGFCGGLTTFSLFSLELWQLLSLGYFVTAGVYMVLTIAGGIMACYLGMCWQQRH